MVFNLLAAVAAPVVGALVSSKSNKQQNKSNQKAAEKERAAAVQDKKEDIARAEADYQQQRADALSDYERQRKDALSDYQMQRGDVLGDYQTQRKDALSDYERQRADNLSDYEMQRADVRSDYALQRSDALSDYERQRTDNLSDYERQKADTLAMYDRQRSDVLSDYQLQRKDNLADYERQRTDALSDYDRQRLDAQADFDRDRALAEADDASKFQRLRDAAQSAGFNPLTALGAGGLTGSLSPFNSVTPGIAMPGIAGAGIGAVSASMPTIAQAGITAAGMGGASLASAGIAVNGIGGVSLGQPSLASPSKATIGGSLPSGVAAKQVMDYSPFIQAGIHAAIPEVTGHAQAAREREKLQNELLSIQIEQARGSARVFNDPRPMGLAVTAHTNGPRIGGSVGAVSGGSGALAQNREVRSITLGGVRAETDPHTDDAAILSDRYGEFGEVVGGGIVAFNDAKHAVRNQGGLDTFLWNQVRGGFTVDPTGIAARTYGAIRDIWGNLQQNGQDNVNRLTSPILSPYDPRTGRPTSSGVSATW